MVRWRDAWLKGQGPGRQRKLPAGFFEANPARDRLTAFKARIFGGFEDMLGADRMMMEGPHCCAIRPSSALAFGGFDGMSTMRDSFQSSQALGRTLIRKRFREVEQTEANPPVSTGKLS